MDGGQSTKADKLEALHGDVVVALERLQSLLQAARPVAPEAIGTRTVSDVLAETEKLRRLELSVAVVASTNAGKSTMINAIIGQDLLPVRKSTMTSVPTRIVHSQVDQPQYSASAEFLAVMTDAWAFQAREVERRGAAVVKHDMQLSIEVWPLIDELASATPLALRQNCEGANAIGSELLRLNDACRLWRALLPAQATRDSLERIDLPEVKAAFHKNARGSMGTLVVVDTPGPNDPNLERSLQELADQARVRASATVLVLDYEQINNEAAASQLAWARHIAEERGTEALYVVVNKVDQRRGDTKADQIYVRQFVAANIGVDDAFLSHRLFEVSARRALAAARVLALSVLSDEATCANSNVKELAAESIDWQDAFDAGEVTIDDAKRWAARTWKRSGFEAFLQAAIKSLVETSVPSALRSSINYGRATTSRLIEQLKVRRGAVGKSVQQLEAELAKIEQDLKRVAAAERSTNIVMHDAEQSLRERVAESRAQIARWAGAAATDAFAATIRLNRRGFFGKLRGRLGDAWDHLAAAKPKPRTFVSETEATIFADQVAEAARSTIAADLEAQAEAIEEGVVAVLNHIQRQIDGELLPVMREASERLGKAFDVELEVRSLNLAADVDLKLSGRPAFERIEGQVHQKKRPLPHNRFWAWVDRYLFTVRPDYETVTVREADSFVVSAESVRNQVAAEASGRIDQEISRFERSIRESVIPIVEKYFADASEHLRAFQRNIDRAKADRLASHDGEQGRLRALDHAISEAAILKEDFGHKHVMLDRLEAAK